MLNPRPKAPFPGGEHTQMIDTGPQGVTPNATRVNLIPAGDGGPGPFLPRVTCPPKKRKPVLPSAAELAALPGGARAAFATRCAKRVEALTAAGSVSADPAGAAAVAILRAASEPWALQFIRRDFERLRRLAEANRWADDTPVPPDVFGPMWPPGRVPKWARATE